MSDVVDVMARVASGPLLFRGQTNHYTVSRPSLVKEILYGDANVDELSLMTAASRAAFEWDHFQYRFQLQSQGLLYVNIPAGRFERYAVNTEGTIHFEDAEIQRRREWWQREWISFEQACMGIAQHYGIPTDGLDLTSDLATALWFATSKYTTQMSNDGELTAWYEPLEAGVERPVIYVVCADLSVDSTTPLASMGGLRSVREERQSARLHYGGWGMHTNLCATETLAAIFLSPACVAEVTRRAANVEHMFPGELEDPLYGHLLALRGAAANVGQPWGFDRIVRYASSG